MKFLKRNQLNFRNVKDLSVAAQPSGEITLGTNLAVLVPKGTTSDRGLSPINGYLRYNTTRNKFEVYQNGAWYDIQINFPSTITKQEFTEADGVEIYFGPLDSGDTDYPFPELTKPQNIMVFVENVFQHSTTNYILEDLTLGNPALNGRDPGRYVKFQGAVPFGKPVIVYHNFDR